MTRLTQKSQTYITVNEVDYDINTSYKSALLTWDVFEAAQTGEISPISAAIIAIDNMLIADVTDLRINDKNFVDPMLQAIAEYLRKYSKVSDKDKKDSKPPLLDLNHDAIMIYDAFSSMGIDLDEQDITYARFMSLLRELPKDAQICRIVYLRQQHLKGKLTKEERAECERRGWEVINIKNRKSVRDKTDNKEHFKELRNKRRVAKGLPPV